MIPSIVATGIREAYDLLHGVASRARDSSPAYDLIVDDVFTFERSWWQLTYGDRTDKEKGRRGRDPRLMRETGSLERTATQRGAMRQTIDFGPDYAFVGITSGLATIHEGLGRPVLGEPDHRTASRMIERVGNFIITGNATRGGDPWLI